MFPRSFPDIDKMGNQENQLRVSRFAAFFRVLATRQAASFTTSEIGEAKNQEEGSTKDSLHVGYHAGKVDNGVVPLNPQGRHGAYLLTTFIDINKYTWNMNADIRSYDIGDNVQNSTPNTYNQAGSMETEEENGQKPLKAQFFTKLTLQIGTSVESSISASSEPYHQPPATRNRRDYTTSQWRRNTCRTGLISRQQPYGLAVAHRISRNWRRPLDPEQAELLVTATANNTSPGAGYIRNETKSKDSRVSRVSTLQNLRDTQFITGPFYFEEVDNYSTSNRSFRYPRLEATSRGLSSNKSSASQVSGGSRNGFRPSYSALGLKAPVNEELARKARELGLNKGNYKGSITQYTLNNAGCTEEENCAVRIENISAYALLKDIFAIIRAGKVYSFYLQLPDGVHSTGAAQLIFMEREAAAKFVEQGNSEDGLVVRGVRLRVLFNRDMTRPVEKFKLEQSRVVRFEGPKDSISIKFLKDLFQGNIDYELVEDSTEEIIGDTAVVKLSFSCVRAQAESALALFYAHFSTSDIRHLVRGWYIQDPCNPENKN
ncbi:hypothetical protein B7494_g1678 [Chlorociboria aeruginascens]|nr:hypothetical protein B7494_g1678 [Chlorociboria aeruginascens]